MSATRKVLGKALKFGSRATIYQVPEGLEIEASEQYHIVQRRVLFDEVVLVTLHREVRASYLLVTGAMAAFFLGIALVILSFNVDAWPAAMIFGIIGVPALLAFLIRMFLGVDVVTVFGRRSKAELHFRLRKARAREVYWTICAAVRSAHRR